MTTRSAEHGTFAIERTYPVPPARAFAAWSSPAAKAIWFGGPGAGAYSLDFRVGGQETNRGGPPDGPVYVFEATYQEIVPDERIVYSYVMDADGTRISVSVTTVEFAASRDGGTRLTFTEQGVYLDAADTPATRAGGTEGILDALGRALG
jgi:uncharacterized protein YndB with AHSA1/START domain